jgi:hypothetical protein
LSLSCFFLFFFFSFQNLPASRTVVRLIVRGDQSGFDCNRLENDLGQYLSRNSNNFRLYGIGGTGGGNPTVILDYFMTDLGFTSAITAMGQAFTNGDSLNPLRNVESITDNAGTTFTRGGVVPPPTTTAVPPTTTAAPPTTAAQQLVQNGTTAPVPMYAILVPVLVVVLVGVIVGVVLLLRRRKRKDSGAARTLGKKQSTLFLVPIHTGETITKAMVMEGAALIQFGTFCC